MTDKIRVVGVSFGDWRKDSTYSGVPKYLLKEMQSKANLIGCVSSKQLRPWDLFDGAVDFSKIYKYGKPGISATWLWGHKALEKLSQRVEKKIRNYESCDAILQIGTHVCLNMNGVRHYCRTDMTVAQGIRANQFSVAKLRDAAVDEAIDVQRKIFENCDGIFVASGWTKESVCKDYGICESKVHVIGEGASLATTKFDYQSSKGNNILFIGRDWHRKGGGLLIDAFRKVRKEVNDCKLTIIGCSPDIKCDGVEVLGFLDKTNPIQARRIAEAYCDASICCVPSFHEPFGLWCLEAQYYGAVPVTFTGQGRAEAVMNGKTGVLIHERSAEALAKVLIEVLTNPSQLAAMREAGRQHVLNNYTWDRVAQKILNIIYEDVK